MHTKTMKAIVWTDYGPPDVLQLQDVAKPIPEEDEVLIKMHATTVTSGDCEQRNLKLPFWQRFPIQAYVGFNKPTRITILGMDFSGEIETGGRAVNRFKPGDSVFGVTGFLAQGTYAEYLCLPVEPEGGALAAKPVNLTFPQAAAVPTGGLEALSFIRQGDLQPGEKILINGAGGTIGTYAVQLARYFDAEVTAVDSSEKLEMLCSIGADHVIDYAEEDFTTLGQRYDFILDVVSKSPSAGAFKSLNHGGRYLIANPGIVQRLRGSFETLTGSRKVLYGDANPNSEDLIILKGLIEQEEIKPVLDRTFSLEQVPEAHRYIETGQKVGNVVISVVNDDS